MTKQTFVPVTEQQALETNIGHSVKISKQVMKQQLKKAIDTAKEAYVLQRNEYSKAHFKFNMLFEESAERQMRSSIRNNSELTRFRNIFTKFSRFNSTTGKEFLKFETNMDLWHEDGCDYEINTARSALYRNVEDNPIRDEFLLGNPVYINVDLVIPDMYASDENCTDAEDMPKLGWSTPVSFGSDVIEAFHVANEEDAKAQALNNQINDLELKLRNIDQVTEEMEAQLLVNELNKTEQGKASLAIASQLVSGMLGTTPELLDLTKE